MFWLAVALPLALGDAAHPPRSRPEPAVRAASGPRDACRRLFHEHCLSLWAHAIEVCGANALRPDRHWECVATIVTPVCLICMCDYLGCPWYCPCSELAARGDGRLLCLGGGRTAGGSLLSACANGTAISWATRHPAHAASVV